MRDGSGRGKCELKGALLVMTQTSGTGSAASGSTSSEPSQGSQQGSSQEARSIPESRGGGTSSTAAHKDESPQGRTTIAASVVEKIAGIAAREITGVYAMGGGVSRAFGALRERIPGGGTSSTSGAQVEVGEKQAAVDLDVIVEYGASIVDIARAVRRNVIHGVERMTGLEVIEVNISVNDIHVPEEGEETREPVTSRVE